MKPFWKIKSTRFYYYYLITVLLIAKSECGFLGRIFGFHRVGENAANTASAAIRESTSKIQTIMQNSVKQIQASVQTASQSLQQASVEISKSLDKGAEEVGSSIRKASDDLVKISDKLTSSIDKGVEEMAGAIREATQATKEITGMLTNSLDNAVTTVGKQVENTLETVRITVSELKQLVDNAFDEFGASIRYLGDRIVEVSQQFNLKVDSGDVVELSKEMKEALIESIKELSTNWKLAVNTADLKDVGATAAAELSKAMQNIQVRVHARFEVGDNVTKVARDVSIAVGIAFSVLFIALVLALRSCRSCLVKCTLAIYTAIQNSNSSSLRNEHNVAPDISNGTVRENNGKWYSKINTKGGSGAKRDDNNEHKDSAFDKGFSSSATKLERDFHTQSKSTNQTGFDKRMTMSLADYNSFFELREKWENGEIHENNTFSELPEKVNLMKKTYSPD